MGNLERLVTNMKETRVILNYGAGGVDKGQALNGPLYKIDDPAHHFDVIIEQAKAMKELQGPIYCDLQHHYHEISKKIETIQGMMGPIYLMDDTRHHYSEVFKNVDE